MIFLSHTFLKTRSYGGPSKEIKLDLLLLHDLCPAIHWHLLFVSDKSILFGWKTICTLQLSVTQVIYIILNRVNSLLSPYVGLVHRKICRGLIPFFFSDWIEIAAALNILLCHQEMECTLYFHVIFLFWFVHDVKVVYLVSANRTLVYTMLDDAPSLFLYQGIPIVKWMNLQLQ